MALAFLYILITIIDMDYVIITNNSITEAANGIGQNIKKSVLFSGAWDGKYAVAAIVIDGVMPKAEVHKNAADIWHILKGRGKFILGGALENEEEIKKGEFVADSIAGGEEFAVSEGDIIDVPPGIPHQINPQGGRIELFIVKINF
jgi:mannose-6-phosphate isomerase-like protein (cupin superfamily)